MRRRQTGNWCFLFVLLASLLSGSVCLSQNTGTPNDLDKNYIPEKSSILNEGGTGSKSRDGRNAPDYHNVIEFTPGLLIRNIFALQYERKITESFSVQAALGAVYGIDRIQKIESPDKSFFNSSGSVGNASTVNLGSMLNQSVFTGPNVYLGFALRLYYEGSNRYNGNYWGSRGRDYDNTESRRYLEAGLRYFGNTVQISNNFSGGDVNIEGTPVINIRSVFYFINWGYHFETDGKIATTHNIFFGFGLRNSSYDVFKTDLNRRSSNGGNLETITASRESILLPTFQFGYEFGLGFK
jgi:hypothetical protein